MVLSKLNTILFISLFFCFTACDKDEDLDSQENHVRVMVKSNSSEIPFTVQSQKHGSLTVKEKWEFTETTKDYYGGISVSCADNTVLLSGKIYVNGKLKAERHANEYLDLTIRLKGDGS